jgi:polysaccharide export outer membrane protein
MKAARLLLAVLAPVLLAAGLPSLQAQGDRLKTEKKNYVHRLALADRLRVAVYQEDDLTTLTRIDSRGRINLPLLGEIAIGGMTIGEAQTAIESAYKDGRFLRNPQVTINVEEYATREVSISGQVRNPARYSLPPESTYTVVELVTKAGGITDIGKGSAVTVTRTQPDGTRKVFTIDVDSIIKGKKDSKSEDILLEAGDNVYVPERLI